MATNRDEVARFGDRASVAQRHEAFPSWHSGGMDETTWGALAVVLTLVGGGYTYWAFRSRGAAAGTRGAALTLLPAAAWMTGTLRMFTRIVDAVVDWATSLVFSPTVWLGVGLAGLSFVLFFLAGLLRSRSEEPGDSGEAVGPKRSATTAGRKRGLPASRQPEPGPVVDDDLADIEAILKRRGIN